MEHQYIYSGIPPTHSTKGMFVVKTHILKKISIVKKKFGFDSLEFSLYELNSFLEKFATLDNFQ